MVRANRRLLWTPEEDKILVDYVNKHGRHVCWKLLPKHAGLLRSSRSCNLRWKNHLCPDIKRGPFTPEEEQLIIQLHANLGNRWAAVADRLPGRTGTEIKNLWTSHLRKRLSSVGLDPHTHQSSCLARSAKGLPASSSTCHIGNAKARLSMDSSALLLLPSPNKTTHPDHILRVWHSEVGEAFRKPVSSLVSGTTSQMAPNAVPELDTELSLTTRSHDCGSFSETQAN